MRIAVNTRMLIKGKMEGIGYFTLETMRRITVQHPEHEFVFLFDRPFDESFIFSGNIVPYSISPPARHPLLWYAWYEWSLPGIFRKTNPDLFVGTDGYLSLSSKQKSVAVIHDLNFEHYPEDLPFFNRWFYRKYFPAYVKQAARIAAVSGFTKDDIVKTYHADASKIDVVYNGASDGFRPLGEDEKKRTREKYSHGSPYLLFVGALHQRKNIANLLRAFELFKKAKSSDVRLILAGQKRWWTKEMEDVYNSMENKADVVITGRIPEEELFNMTGSALAITYISAFEGFGIPIVEAMKCDVPVITSNVTSMPEIAGDAALLCDPFSVESIRDAMLKVYSDETFRNKLVERGRKRRELFTWQKSADALWKCIERSL